MIKVKEFVKRCLPYGVIERHRRNFRMNRLELPGSPQVAKAVDACRYDLWPVFLRDHSPGFLVDVGANEGEFIAAASLLADWQGVYAFEPLKEVEEPLRAALAEFPRSSLQQAAVGDQNGEIELVSTANTKMASVLAPDKGVESEYPQGDFAVVSRVKVPVVRLDDVIPKDIVVGLLKIDVQGYELPVLAGAVQTLQRTRSLLIEVNYVAHYESGSTFDQVYRAIVSHGFRLHGISTPYGGKNGPLWRMQCLSMMVFKGWGREDARL